MKRKNKILEILEYVFVKLIFNFFLIFPYYKGIKYGSKLFKLLYFIQPLKKIAYKNLEIIFHDFENYKKEKNINISFNKFRKNIFLKHLENLGKVFFTLLFYPKLEKDQIYSLLRNEVDMSLFNNLFNEKKGLICASLHFGNWELNGIYFSLLGYPINVIMRPLDNKLLDNYLQKFRTDKGVKIISKFDPPMKFIRPLLKGEILAILADQNTLKHGIFIPFFRKIASSNQGVAKFHIITKSNIIIMYSYYENDTLILKNDIQINPEILFNNLSNELKAKLFLFNEFFNLNNKIVDIEFFDDLIYFDNYKNKNELKIINKEEKNKIINNYILNNKEKFYNFNFLKEEEKIFFINYFYHQRLEKIIKEKPENWMLIHERWKKQPEDFYYLY